MTPVSRRVLIVEDDFLVSLTTIDILESIGCEIGWTGCTPRGGRPTCSIGVTRRCNTRHKHFQRDDLAGRGRIAAQRCSFSISLGLSAAEYSSKNFCNYREVGKTIGRRPLSESPPRDMGASPMRGTYGHPSNAHFSGKSGRTAVKLIDLAACASSSPPSDA